jgi:hypothetical protein
MTGIASSLFLFHRARRRIGGPTVVLSRHIHAETLFTVSVFVKSQLDETTPHLQPVVPVCHSGLVYLGSDP